MLSIVPRFPSWKWLKMNIHNLTVTAGGKIADVDLLFRLKIAAAAITFVFDFEITRCDETAFVGRPKLFTPGVNCTVSQHLLLPVALTAIPPEMFVVVEVVTVCSTVAPLLSTTPRYSMPAPERLQKRFPSKANRNFQWRTARASHAVGDKLCSSGAGRNGFV